MKIKEKEQMIEKYKEKIKEIYQFQYDEETAHGLRDNIYRDLVEELGYKELADLLEYEDDLGKTIRFDKPTTMVEKFVNTNDYDDCHYTYGMFTPREIIAIAQQFIELGVLDGELLEKEVE